MFADLYAHQEWADAVVWNAIMKNDAAKNDERIRHLFAHLHLTQTAFLETWRGDSFKYRDSSSFADADEVMRYGRDYHRQIHDFVARVRELDVPMVMPWAHYFRKDAAVTTMRDTLTQVPMHSTYHRGQVNARLREVGGEPPLTDYIAWIWLGRPLPSWEGNDER
jgi:uncharacterized damage-inducible protein DinB